MKLGLALMCVGLVLMIFGAGSTAFPQLSTLTVGGDNGVSVTNIPPFSASFMFIGIVISLMGLYLYKKR